MDVKLENKVRKIVFFICCFFICFALSFGQTWNLTATMTATLNNGTLTIKSTRNEEAMPNFINNQPWALIRPTVISVIIETGVTTIGNYAFYGCSSLSSATIPNTVTYIGEATFRGCSSLSSVTIPNSVTYISDLAFYDCSSLRSIKIPDSVRRIGVATFCGCSSLVSVTIPNSITTIEESAFLNCSSLTSVTIPNSVTTIGQFAFQNCSNLKDITVHWIVPLSFLRNGLMPSEQASTVTLHVPAGSEHLYKAASHWKDYKIVTFTTNNESTSSQSLKVYSSNGTLHIMGLQLGKPLNIYSIDGQLVYKRIVKAEEESIPIVAKGVYIIVVGNQTIKSVVE